MLETSITVPLPIVVFEQLKHSAHKLKRSVPDMVRELVLQEVSLLPSLPPDVEAELAALAHLSDEALWLLARGTLSQAQQFELASLNRKAGRRRLTEVEKSHQQELIERYDRMLVRRAEAAQLLKARGYDLSNPSVLEVS